MSSPRRGAAAQPELAWAAGAVARRLGIPPSTLRAWNRRYGIGPADHQAGRQLHRRRAPDGLGHHHQPAPRRPPQPPADRARRVLLACAEGEQHDLPLEALHAALTQHGVSVRMLGPSVSADAMEDAIRRTAPAAVVLFAQVPRTARPTVLRRIRATTVNTIAAGSGWRQTALPADVSLATSLEHALELVRAAVRPPVPTPA